MKQCVFCRSEKNGSEFNKNKTKSDGLSNICKSCSREKSRDYYSSNSQRMRKQIKDARRRRKIESRIGVVEYLRTHPCVDCGEDNPVLLEFDHIHSKVECISILVAKSDWSWNKIKTEIDKCEVRCCKCHRIKTANDFGWYKVSPYSTTDSTLGSYP